PGDFGLSQLLTLAQRGGGHQVDTEGILTVQVHIDSFLVFLLDFQRRNYRHASDPQTKNRDSEKPRLLVDIHSYDDALRATTPGKQFSGYTNPTIMNPYRGTFSSTGIGPCIARRLNSFACRLHHHIRLRAGGLDRATMICCMIAAVECRTAARLITPMTVQPVKTIIVEILFSQYSTKHGLTTTSYLPAVNKSKVTRVTIPATDTPYQPAT